MTQKTTYEITRADGVPDRIAGRRFARFDEAYAVLEEYYADSCCTNQSEIYRIVEAQQA